MINVTLNKALMHAEPEKQILLLHKILWLVAREVLFLSNDDADNSQETYEFSMLEKEEISVNDLDWFIQLEHEHPTYGRLAYEQLHPEERYQPSVDISNRKFGNWFKKEKYLEAEIWVKNNKAVVFDASFCDFMQVIPYDGNTQEHLAFLHKVLKLLSNETIHLHTYDEQNDTYADDKAFMSVTCSDTFCMACCDSETFSKKDIDTITQLSALFGYAGIVAWVSSRRDNQKPLFSYARLNVERYNEAVEYLLRLS
jgi:hypothetical protein